LDIEELREGMREHMTAIYFDVCDFDDFLECIDADNDGLINF
jgi:calcium-dependent protein kinase